ncbi:uncharacterized protein LOC111624339 [Centruroides sculpturatus]|uniref:uncharacterized protein LOC111624339 n=1 Tax=Centruroides sculpturatus TaxID=218467 RepID=UPI000C6CA059|nr:uncharacterized protein LOC111624339 [Centruroides sculpturatus]
MKGKLKKTVVRLAMFSAEMWAIKRDQEKKMERVEMKMLRWICDVMKKDRIRNDYLRGTIRVGSVSTKVQQSRLKWFGHVRDYVGKRIGKLKMIERRNRGRPKLRWRDKVAEDLGERRWRREDTLDREVEKTD